MPLLAILAAILLVGGLLCATLMAWAFSNDDYGSRAMLPNGRTVDWKDWDQEAFPPAPMTFREKAAAKLAIPFVLAGTLMMPALLWVLRATGRNAAADSISRNLD